MKTLIIKEDAVKALEQLMNELSVSGETDKAKGVYRALRLIVKQEQVFSVSELEMMLNKQEPSGEMPDMDSIRASFKMSPISYKTFSEMTGISSSALHRYISGQVKRIPLEAAKEMEDALRSSGYYAKLYPKEN